MSFCYILIKTYFIFLNRILQFREKVIYIVTVFVEDIATAFDEHFYDWQQFLNTKTGEIVILSNDGVLDTDKELAEEIDSTDDYIRLPCQYELHEYRIMENFTDTITNEKMASKLWRALNGKKPFRHFKDTINYLGIAQDYYKFRFQAYLDIAVEWCEDHQIPYEWKNPPKEFLDDNNASYDTLAKRILSRKVILARILKYTVPEFADCSLEDIAGKYIEGDPTADINTIPLDDTLYIKGSQNESNSPNEKVVTFDIIFEAIVPDTGKPIQLIINVEPQKAANPGYPIIKRALYYTSRLISSQKEKYFVGDDYAKIRKVYSIWVIMDATQERSNLIQRFKLTEELLHGTFHEKIKNYDLMTIILLNLGEGEMSHDLLKMLHLIFLDLLKTEQKEEILLDDYGIKLTRDMREEIDRMGGLMQPAIDMAVRKAVSQAVAEKEAEKKAEKETDRLDSIRKIMKNMSVSAQEAMNALEIPADEQPKYAALI